MRCEEQGGTGPSRGLEIDVANAAVFEEQVLPHAIDFSMPSCPSAFLFSQRLRLADPAFLHAQAAIFPGSSGK